MKQTLDIHMFREEFLKVRPENFTFEGIEMLFNYFEALENDTGEEIEFDPIAICCEYTEYNNLEEILNNYPRIKSLAELRDNTTVLECANDHIIIQNF